MREPSEGDLRKRLSQLLSERDELLGQFERNKKHCDQIAETAAADRNKSVVVGSLGTAALTGMEWLTKLPAEVIFGSVGVGAVGTAYFGYGFDKIRRESLKRSSTIQRNIYEVREGLEITNGDRFTGAG